MKILKNLAMLLALLFAAVPVTAQLKLSAMVVPGKMRSLDQASLFGLSGELAYRIPKYSTSVYIRMGNIWMNFEFNDPDYPSIERSADVQFVQNIIGVRYHFLSSKEVDKVNKTLYGGLNWGSMNFSQNAGQVQYIGGQNRNFAGSVGDGSSNFRIGVELGFELGVEQAGLHCNVGFSDPGSFLEIAMGIYLNLK